ncbi:MAG: hypothetical protein BWY28_03087 [bacterium ADurb.Bin236]|nr:MAG: hypothetical protein BWY28_03087 [bacterium ADurb.Bin236]
MKTPLTPEDRAIVERDILAWREVRQMYEFCGDADGREALEEKTSECILCRVHEEHDLEESAGRVTAIAKCRRCPIVKSTGRTCLAAYESAGLPLNWERAAAAALPVIDRIIAFLQNLIGE